MSVYTSHWLKVMEVPRDDDNYRTEEDIKKIIAELRESNDCAEHAIDEDGNYADLCKWYTSTQDLMEFSKKHKDFVFELFCIGEHEEEWIEIFVNGNYTHRNL